MWIRIKLLCWRFLHRYYRVLPNKTQKMTISIFQMKVSNWSHFSRFISFWKTTHQDINMNRRKRTKFIITIDRKNYGFNRKDYGNLNFVYFLKRDYFRATVTHQGTTDWRQSQSENNIQKINTIITSKETFICVNSI